MAMEAELLADRGDTPEPKERRARSERRGPDRRRDGSRINPNAPRRSMLKPLGALGVALSAVTFIITLVAGEAAGSRATTGIIAFEAAILLTSIILLAMGAIESRLIEIRLELMMLNGGTRGADRREGSRRSDREET